MVNPKKIEKTNPINKEIEGDCTENMQRYIILYDNTLEGLQEKVNNMLVKGYTLAGGVSATDIHSLQVVYMQAVIKEV